jgi:hypothetical protein
MTKFLNTSGAYAQIEEVICNARKRLVLITPFIKMPESLLGRVSDRSRNGIQVVIVCRKEDLKSDEKEGLKHILNLDLRFLEKLHAKCFYNEDTMVITSLNLYESSSQNREMGILLSLDNDSDVFKKALEEAEFIVREAKKDTAMIPEKQPRNHIRPQIKEPGRFYHEKSKQPSKSFVEIAVSAVSNLISTSSNGHCIRCGETITYEPSKPLCPKCFGKWQEYANPEYGEKYCHYCGERHKTTFIKPLCRACYQIMERR